MRSILALMLREMQSSYGRSPGGYVWAVLEPVGAIALFTFVISVGLKIREPSIGASFPLFYATGILPFILYSGTASKIARSLKFSRQLLRYPCVRFTDALMARLALNLLTHLLVFFSIITGIIFFFDLDVSVSATPILVGLVAAALLGLGVTGTNAAMATGLSWQDLKRGY